MKARQLEILNILNEKKQVSVQELADCLDMSAVTIRKDLEELEDQGLLRRQHGYASLVSPDAISSRMSLHYLEKQEIAKEAVSMVEPMETVMIESGSTCALFAQELVSTYPDVTIITNSAFIAHYVSSVGTAKVVLLGGDYDVYSEVTTGPITELCAKEYYVDKIFVGIDGYTEDAGFTNVNHTRCSAARGMAEQADKVIVLSPSDKFGRRSVARMFSADEVFTVITDSALPEEYRKSLKKHHVSVDLVG